MKKSFKTLIIIGIIVLVFVGLYSTIKGYYNSFVTKDEGVQAAWSQVENQYQRRFDLIPNLIGSAKGYMEHEEGVFVSITEARASVGQMKVDIHDAEQFAQYQNAQAGLTQALSKLLMVHEAYPELKADPLVAALMTDLGGTENRIATERMRYNETVKDFNIAIRVFPANLFAGLFGFEKAQLFEMDAGAENAPSVKDIFES